MTAGVSASVRTAGASYDNALAGTVNGPYEAELTHSKRGWDSTRAIELPTTSWAHWWATARLHMALGYAIPVERETGYTQK